MKNYPNLSRRSFLKSSSLATATAFLPACGKQAQESGISERYKGLNSSDYLGPLKTETRIDDSAIFTEGPAVDAEGNVYFTNIRVSKILKWNTHTKALSTFRENSNAANGLRFDPQGNLLACEGESGRVTRTHMRTGEISVLADNFAGKQLQSPNDLDYDSQGRIYFTSRTNNPDLEKENLKSVYRLDPNGTVTQLLAEPNVHMPNGIIVSPDEKTLHLIEAHGEASRNRCIFSYDLAADGSISNQRKTIDFYPGRSGDGMCVDEAGNLYVAAGLHNERGSSETLDTRPGLHVISPEGELLAFAKTPEETITNSTFGGEDLKTLYITSGSYLLSLRTAIAGKASYRTQS
ncbi:MAG: SMP-30/gluconolactonase/LRE family protein [Opitutales bacterium]|jgi:gluconolactonase|nr:SMP-30/gluconolactonase/LRE family protein [Opitutales bacterium]